MSGIKSIIGLVAGALGLYWYKRNLDAEYEQRQKELDQERQDYIEDIEELEDELYLNNEETPIRFTGKIDIGGGKIDHLKITLTAYNETDRVVSIGDFRCGLTIEGIESLFVKPSNITTLNIQPNSSVDFVLYKDNWNPYPSGVYQSLHDAIVGKKSGTSAYLNISFLWYVANEKEECFVRNLKLSVSWMGNNWHVGKPFVGYNACDKDSQKENPSHWTKYDTHDE